MLGLNLDTMYTKNQCLGLFAFLKNFETNLLDLVELGEEQYEQEATKKRKVFAALSHDPIFSWVTMFSKTNAFTEIMVGLCNLGVRHDKRVKEEARAQVRSIATSELTAFINSLSQLGPEVWEKLPLDIRILVADARRKQIEKNRSAKSTPTSSDNVTTSSDTPPNSALKQHTQP